MATVAYIRVSTAQQNLDRQFASMEGIVDKVFIEKQSAKDLNRPELRFALDYVREGDTLIVESFSRIARSTKELLEVVELLAKKKVQLISQKEALDTNTASGKLMLGIFAAISQFERDILLERQAEGIAAAKAKGVKLGRPRKTFENFEEVYTDWNNEIITASSAARRLGVARSSFYRYAKNFEGAN